MKPCNSKPGEIRKDRKTFVGAILLVIGVILLGRNLHIIPYPISHHIFSWPMILILIGIIFIASKGKSVSGLFMIGVGSIFLLDKMFPFSHFQWQIAWPLLFIFVGAALVVIYLGNSVKEIIQSKPTSPKTDKKKSKYANVEFDIDKIEPIED